MIESVHIDRLHFQTGASAGLPQKTVRVTAQFRGDGAAWHAQCKTDPVRVEAVLAQVLPGQTAQAREIALILQERAPLAALGDAVVALCVSIQREAGDAVWHGAVLSVSEAAEGPLLTMALPWVREGVVREALNWALRWWMLLGQSASTDVQRAELARTYREWLEKVKAGGLAPNTMRFALAAHARGWPMHQDGGKIRIGWGAMARTFHSSFTDQTSQMAARTARDKYDTSRLLHQALLPAPSTARVRDWAGALKIAEQFGWPVVVKPGNQDQGIAVVPGITNEAALRTAFDEAAKYSPGAVIVEKHIPGDDYRLLVVKGRLLMATRRIPGGVTGDGQHTVAQLVDIVNADPRRGTGKRDLLINLSFDAEALDCLAEQKLEADRVPEAGRFVPLRRTANISTGGTAEDATAIIHPDNQLVAERAARLIGLDIAGVDFLCPDISRSWREVGGGICEVNAQPGFRPHWLSAPERDINGEILDILFAGCPPRIPTAAITGTNGKTTTARMLHHVWQVAGKVAGVATTQGIWVGHDCLSTKNLSGMPGGRLLLDEPTVEAAVLEMPRKGLIRFGHPCDRYDVAALLNLQDDHIGVDGIGTIEQMAELKAEVLQRASEAIVVNADDPLSLRMRERAAAPRHILVTRDAGNPEVARHRARGGQAAIMAQRGDKPWIVLATGAEETVLMPAHDIPATMNGLLRFNESNALFAAALAWAQGLPLEVIRRALGSFHNSPEQNPGRYNFIAGLPFQVLLDFAHNPDGYAELFRLAADLPVSGRRILASVVGNRDRHQFKERAPAILRIFDHIYLSQNPQTFPLDACGYGTEDPLGGLLEAARDDIGAHLRPDQKLTLGRDRQAVLEQAIAQAGPGDLLVLLADPGDVLPMIERYRRKHTDEMICADSPVTAGPAGFEPAA